MSVVEPVRDEKAGWSSMCRRGETRMCVTAGAACTNPKHGAKEARRPAAVEKEKPMPQADGLTWEDPPTRQGGKPIITSALIEAMQAHPKRWLRVKDYPKPSSAYTASNRLKKGEGGIGDAAGWEFQGCRHDNGSTLYVRWVGTEGA